jgi:hypothetical protein
MAGITVQVLKHVLAEKADTRGHTYIHFGGTLKTRLKTLAEKAGYTRKLNEFGVAIFEQALTLAEADFERQLAEANAKRK